jgi:uncharacterized damage-inducible protein DinB
MEQNDDNRRSSMRILTTIPATIFLSVAIPASAQSPAPANPIASGVRTSWDGAKRNLTRSADEMPASDYGFRPVDTVRTFGQILAHVAGANYVFCSAAKGEKSPHAEDAFEKTATTRAQIVKALADSIAYCDAAYAALDDRHAAEMVELPFGMGKGARALPLMMNTGHLQEHYGNLVTYFRVKGMVPPSSQPAK